MNKRDAFAIEIYKIKLILKYCYSPLPDEINTSEVNSLIYYDREGKIPKYSFNK